MAERASDGSHVERALLEAAPSERFVARILRNSRGLVVGETSYPRYPIETFDLDDYWLCREGRIYSTDPLATELEEVVAAIFDPTAHREELVEWLKNTDGEFVLYAVEKATGRVAIMNDLLGRLPVYWYDDGRSSLATRDIGVAHHLLDALQVDRLAVAQCLLFGFPLGDRTLWDEVQRLPPATVLTMSANGGTELETLFEFNFGERTNRNRNIDENADELAARFTAACANRDTAGKTNVVSLSGGHDSRAVAAGYRNANVSFEAATFRRPDGKNEADVDIAEEVAKGLGVDWLLSEIDEPTGDRLRQHLNCKWGHNHLGMAYILGFFEALLERHDRGLVYLTGDGGDKALPALTPPRPLDDIDELASYLLSKDSLVFDLEDVVELVDVTRTEIEQSLKERLRTYPETDPAQQYVHFKVYERGVNWLFEGEDRNRYYFWSTTPFYSPAVFSYAMNVPEAQKAGNRLYREFLDRLWTDAITFDDANFGVSMASRLYPYLQRVLGVLARYPSLEDLVRTVYRDEVGYRYDESISNVLERQRATCDAIGTNLSTDALRRVERDRGSCGRQEVYNLLTVTSAIELGTKSETTLSDFETTNFT